MNLRKPVIIGSVIACSVLVLFVLVAIGLMGGADYRIYPSEKASRWMCEDPHLLLDFSEEQSYLVWNGEKLPVATLIRASYFDLYLDTDPDPSGAISAENVLFRGTWKYKGDTLVVSIDEDNIFDGAYTELVFYPQ